MEEQLVTVLESLGSEGIRAVYVYLALEYGGLWVLIGLIAWGVRTVWAKTKDDM